MANDTYTLAGDGSLYLGTARPVAALPAYLVGKAAHEVVNLPSPSASGAIDQSSMGGNSVANIVEAYSGASVMDLRRYTLHGGGHSDMGRNDILDIDLGVDSPVWRTVKATTPYAQWISGSPYYQDGAPAAIHTYYCVQQDALTGRLIRLNYWGGFAFNGQAPQGSGAADQRSAYIDAFDFGSGQWVPQAYGPIPVLLGSETAVAKDHVTGDIYALSVDNNVWKYAAADHSVSQVANLAGTEGGGGPIVVDSINQRIIRFSGRSATGAVQYNMASSFAKSAVTFTGPAAAALNSLGPSWGFGCAHDTTSNAVYLMTNGGTPTIYRIRLSDFYAEVITTTGQAVQGDTNSGLWGRLVYVKSTHSVAWLGMWAKPVQVMRCA